MLGLELDWMQGKRVDFFFKSQFHKSHKKDFGVKKKTFERKCLVPVKCMFV